MFTDLRGLFTPGSLWTVLCPTYDSTTLKATELFRATCFWMQINGMTRRLFLNTSGNGWVGTMIKWLKCPSTFHTVSCKFTLAVWALYLYSDPLCYRPPSMSISIFLCSISLTAVIFTQIDWCIGWTHWWSEPTMQCVLTIALPFRCFIYLLSPHFVICLLL